MLSSNIDLLLTPSEEEIMCTVLFCYIPEGACPQVTTSSAGDLRAGLTSLRYTQGGGVGGSSPTPKLHKEGKQF